MARFLQGAVVPTRGAVRRRRQRPLPTGLGFQPLESRLVMAGLPGLSTPPAPPVVEPPAMLAAIVAPAAAASDFSFVREGGRAVITGYSGTATDVTVPATIGGLPVGSIGYRAFWNAKWRITSVTISPGISVIEEEAFAACDRLTSLTLPDGLTTIGPYAFDYCSGLKSVRFPASLSTIDEQAFRGSFNLSEAIFLGNAPKLVGKPFRDTPASFAIIRMRSTIGWDAVASLYPVYTTADAPTITLAQAGEERARLSWSAPAFTGGGISSYDVQVSRDGGDWQPVAMTSLIFPTNTSITVNHLVNGSAYRFRVAVVNPVGSGEYAVTSGLVPAAPVVPVSRLPVPADVSATAGNGTATLRWSPLAGAFTGYRIEASSDGGWMWTSRGQAGRAATTATVMGLTNGVAYQFRIAAFDAGGTAGFSRVTPAATAVPATGGGAEKLTGSSTTALQFTPDGRLAELVEERVLLPDGRGVATRLVYRVAGKVRDMTEDVLQQDESPVGVPHFDIREQPLKLVQNIDGTVRYVPDQGRQPLQLVTAADGTAHILSIVPGATGQMLLHLRLDGDGWRTAAFVPLVTPLGYGIEQFEARMAADGSLHFVAGAPKSFDSESTPGVLIYGTNRGGSWTFERITDNADVKGFPHAGPTRAIGLAIDAAGRAHVVYTPSVVVIAATGRYSRLYSELAYATNRTGRWVTEIVHRPADGTGESGSGASIAISPSGQPVIAHFEVDSVATGSYVSAQLLVEQRKPAGGWTTETVASTPDGYGATFTGFAPLIAFEKNGMPHVAFSDFAIFYADGVQQQLTGQLRHAWKEAGAWRLETLFRQSVGAQIRYPALTIGPQSIVFSGRVYTGFTAADTAAVVKVVRPLPDTTPPVVTKVEPPAAKAYGVAGEIVLAVTFSETVVVTGSPTIPVVVGGAARVAAYADGSGGSVLRFKLVVKAGDLDTDGIAVGRSFSFAGGAIRDTAGNAVTAALPAVDARRVLVDAVAPVVVAVSAPPAGPFTVGQAVTVRVTFSKTVVVTGAPSVLATVGTVPRSLAYAGGSGSKVLTFTYLLASSDVKPGRLVKLLRLSLPTAAAIRDAAANPLASTALPVK